MELQNFNNSQTMSSREIAQLTGKRHSDILNAIRKMECAWENVTGRTFSLSEYTDATGRKLPEYQLDKRETLFVGSKFKDEDRAKLVVRWEKLEIEKQQSKPLTTLDILVQQTNVLVEQNQRIDVIEEKIKHIEAKTTTSPDYFAVAGYASLNGIAVSLPVAGTIGRMATKKCKDENIMMGKIHDPRFGEVNTYPMNVLEVVFKNYFTKNLN